MDGQNQTLLNLENDDIFPIIDRIKGTVVNRALPSLHGPGHSKLPGNGGT